MKPCLTRRCPEVTRLVVGLSLIHAVMTCAMLQAQAVNSVPPAPDASPAQDEPITLSPFQVSTDQDVGYLAGNTLAGSRLNTALKDTPAAISVFTSEFLSDLGAFDISEAMAYAVNVEFDLDDDRSAINGNSTVHSYQEYRVRGLAASTARNYFKWDIPAESALIERIEDSRGPNSVLFGIAAAGGLINAMTKQAHTGRAFRRLSYTLMSHDSHRGTLDLNQPLIGGKLAVRLNAVYNQTNTHRHWQFQETRRAHLAVKYALSERTQFRAEYERGQIDSNAPRHANLIDRYGLWDATGRPVLTNRVANASLGVGRQNATLPRFIYVQNEDQVMSMTGTLFTQPLYSANEPIMDTSIADRSINISGPDGVRFSHFTTFSGFLEHRFSKGTFLEVAYNHQDHTFDRMDPQIDAPQRLEGDPNATLNDGSPNPYAGQLFIEGGWHRVRDRTMSDTVRSMLSTEFDFGRWGNYRLAGMGEYEKGFTGGSTEREMWYDADTGLPAINPVPHNTQNFVRRRTYVTPGDWVNYYISGPGKGDGLFNNVADVFSGRRLSSQWVINGSGANRESYSDLVSVMGAVQARYFKDRLIVAAGLRRDTLKRYHLGTMLDPATGQYIVARNDADAVDRLNRTHDVGTTSTLGFVYHAKPWLSLFYNQSDNVSLPGSGFRLPDSGEPGNPIPLTSPQGETEDYGLAVTLLEGRLYARATFYETAFVNQSTTSSEPVRNGNQRIMEGLFTAGLISQQEFDLRTNVGNQGLFDHATTGVEFQVTANATRNWRFQLSFAKTETVETNLFKEWRNWHQINLQYLSQFDLNSVTTTEGGRTIAEEIDLYLTTNNGLNSYLKNDGQHKLGNRPYKANFFTRYNFSSGPLRGLYIGGGYRYQGKLFTGIDSDATGNELWAPAFGQADVMAGYTVRGLPKGRRMSFQLNILNVLDEQDPIILRYHFPAEERRVLSMKPRDPLSWRFTTNFEF